jgi:hypothetical protein
MKIGQLVQVTAIAGVAVFTMAASALAATITFNTNAAGTMFAGDGLTLNNSLGSAATLTFTPDANATFGAPSNVNYGVFTLACPNCSTQAVGAGSFFNPFTFDLVISDLDNGANGLFTGSSTGGFVWSDVSQVTVTWVPLTIGPLTNNATSGDFGSAIFDIEAVTAIVAPNSGIVAGQSTVQGHLDVAGVPEPATLTLAGGALFILGMVRRRRLPRAS